MKPSKFSQKERRLLLLCGLLMLALVGGGSWWTWSNTTPQIVIPASPPAPSPNAFDYYIKAVTAFVFVPSMSEDPGFSIGWDIPLLDAEHPQVFKKHFSATEGEKWLAKNAKALSLMRQGFAFRCRITDKGNSRLYTLARLLSTECRVRAIHGDWKGASRSALDTLHLGADIGRGGGLVAFGMSRTIIKSFALNELRAVSEGLDAPSARTVALEIHEQIKQYPTAAEIFKEEKRSTQNNLMEIFGNSGWREIIAQEYPSREWERMYRTPTRWEQVGDKVEACQTWLRGIPLSKQMVMSNYTAIADAAIAAAEKPYTPLRLTGNDTYNRSQAQFYEKYHFNYQIFLNAMGAWETAFALRAYRLERGIYPDSLDALVPNYLPTVPHDAFAADQPLHYIREGATYKLWSVGPDGKDDGGQPNLSTSRSTAGTTPVDADSKGDFAYSPKH